MQNILLAGPTGNLGPHLAKALKNNGKNVFACGHDYLVAAKIIYLGSGPFWR